MLSNRGGRDGGTLSSMTEIRNPCKIVVDTSEGRDHLRDLDMNRRIILKWIIEIGWFGFN
jgi:hypothetical protein